VGNSVGMSPAGNWSLYGTRKHQQKCLQTHSLGGVSVGSLDTPLLEVLEIPLFCAMIHCFYRPFMDFLLQM